MFVGVILDRTVSSLTVSYLVTLEDAIMGGVRRRLPAQADVVILLVAHGDRHS